MGTDFDAEYVAFVRAIWPRYTRLARLLTGDRHRGEDLLQDCLVKLYLRWRRVTQRGDPHAYLQRMLINGSISRWRRGRFSYVRPTDDPVPVEDHTVSGTIEVNAFSGRVSKVVSHIPSAAASINVSTNQRVNLASMDQTVEFSDYGKPVDVSEPSDFVNVAPSPR